MTLKDKINVQVGIVNQSLSAVMQGFEAIELCEAEKETTSEEKLGIKAQLYARIDHHMVAARKAFESLEQAIAVKR